jgi:Transcription factor WhiB
MMTLIPNMPTNGACAGKNVEMFFPEPPWTRERRRMTTEALKTCEQCDVKRECLQYALEWELHGIWGGTMPKERELMRREQRITLRHRSFNTVDGTLKIS